MQQPDCKLELQTVNIELLLSQQLHWLPAYFHAQIKGLVLTYQALNGLGLNYLKDRISLHESAWT